MSSILGIETSCDECSAAIVTSTGKDESLQIQLKALATFSQIKLHAPFGGVVPEVASRNHLENIQPIIHEALNQAGVEYSDLDAIAVTNRPGLIGALLVGVTTAKALAYTLERPLIPIHHLEGHISSLFLNGEPLEHFRQKLPCLVAVISGGHTNLYLMQDLPTTWKSDWLKTRLIGSSRDDAAGEAFDKTAKLLGFEYPGGAKMDQMAKAGNPKAYALPRALPQKSTLDFSFSGLKTASALLIEKMKKEPHFEKAIPDLCASIQEAIVDALVIKMKLAIDRFDCQSLAIVGGVAANSRLRERLQKECEIPFFAPDPSLCVDNAAMIAAAGLFRFQKGEALSPFDSLRLNAYASAEF